MEEKILEIIYECTYDSIFKVETYIEKIVSSLYDYYNIGNSQFYKINFDTYDGIASYDNTNKKFNFNLKKILQLKESVFRLSKEYNLSLLDSYLFYNLIIIRIIFHEFEHLLQYRKIKFLDKESDELKLLEYSLLFIPSRDDIKGKYGCYDVNGNLYLKYHDLFPIERMADINSFKKINSMLNIDSSINEIISNYFNLSYLDCILKLYQENEGRFPFEEFLYVINHEELIKKLNFYDDKEIKMIKKCKRNYNLDSRIFYGFYIDEEEKEQMLVNYEVEKSKYKKLIK